MGNNFLNFFKIGLIFTMIFIILFLAINDAYIFFVFDKKTSSRVFRQFNNLEIEGIDTIFFGDSHPARSINPFYIEKSFNYSSLGETYEQTYYKIRQIVNNNPNINNFVIPIDIHSFSNYRKNPYYNIKYWSKFIDYNELSFLSEKSKFEILLLDNLPVIGDGIEILRYFINKNKQAEIFYGWQKEISDFSLNENGLKSAINRIDRQIPNYPLIKDGKLIKSFYKILDLLKKEGKKIILIKYPLTDEYLTATNKKEINLEKFYSEFYNISSNNDNVYLFDYQKRYSEKSFLFSDSDHLNYKGAEIFSKEINYEINNIRVK